jgi:putative aldouronate transport system substrate-binding protein
MEMIMKHRIGIALVVSTGLALTGCGASTPTQSKLDTISIMAPFFEAQPPAAGDTVQKAIEKLTGKKIAVTWVPNSSYEDKMNITMAGGDLPDVMLVEQKSPGFIKNANAGAFWELGKYLKDYPNLVSKSPAIQRNASVNGKIFGIYRSRDALRTAVILRKDWLAKLGLQPPKNVGDLYNIAKAFTNQDPDGDGKKDTYGLIVPKWPGGINTNSPYDVMSTWFGAGNGWVERDNKLVPNFTTDEWMQANEYIKRFVSEGLINPDYATMDANTWDTPFFAGKGGIIIDVQSRATEIMNLFKAQNPKTFQNYVEFTGNLEGPTGQLVAQPTDGYSGFLAIPKSSVPTEAGLRTVLSFLNKLDTPQGNVLLNNGIEGVNFTRDGDLSVPVTPLTAEGKQVTEAIKSYAQLGMGTTYYLPKQPSAYEQSMFEKRIKIQASDLTHAVYNPAAPYVSATEIAKGAVLDNIIADARVQYLAGQLSEQGLRDAIKRWRTSGGDDVISEINALHDKGK